MQRLTLPNLVRRRAAGCPAHAAGIGRTPIRLAVRAAPLPPRRVFRRRPAAGVDGPPRRFMSPQRQCVPHLCPDTHCLPHQVGLPEDDLHARVALHRGVYCRGGALTPTDTTLFTLCPAQHFNACLPLGGKRLYRCPGHTEAEGVLCFRVRCNSTRAALVQSLTTHDLPRALRTRLPCARKETPPRWLQAATRGASTCFSWRWTCSRGASFPQGAPRTTRADPRTGR